MESAARHDFFNKVQIAAGFDSNRVHPSLYQHMGYRKAIAEQILNDPNPEQQEQLEELFVRVTNEIKYILGI